MSWLETELREQPEALARLLERQADSARTAGRLFRRHDIRYLLIASRGSSSNVARYAQYLLGRAHRVPVMFATPSLILWRSDGRLLRVAYQNRSCSSSGILRMPST